MIYKHYKRIFCLHYNETNFPSQPQRFRYWQGYYPHFCSKYKSIQGVRSLNSKLVNKNVEKLQRCSDGSSYKLRNVITDERAEEVLALLRVFPGAAVLIQPSTTGGAAVITHQMALGVPMLRIDGLLSKSPLSNNALYSFEYAQIVNESAVEQGHSHEHLVR